MLLDDIVKQNYYSGVSNFFNINTPIWCFSKNHREGGSSYVQLRPQPEPLDSIEGFLGSLRFEHRSKLDQLEIEIGSFDTKIADFGSSPIPCFWITYYKLLDEAIQNSEIHDFIDLFFLHPARISAWCSAAALTIRCSRSSPDGPLFDTATSPPTGSINATHDW